MRLLEGQKPKLPKLWFIVAFLPTVPNYKIKSFVSLSENIFRVFWPKDTLTFTCGWEAEYAPQHFQGDTHGTHVRTCKKSRIKKWNFLCHVV